MSTNETDAYFCLALNDRAMIEDKNVPSKEIDIGTTVMVSTDTLHVRTGPGTDYGMLKKASRGDKLSVFECHSGWVYVKTLGGWLCTEYLAAT